MAREAWIEWRNELDLVCGQKSRWRKAKNQKAKRRAWRKYMRACGQVGV